jgi:predicted RNase H-like HicB family nuclease
MGFGYRYTLERQKNGWWLVRFPGIPEALTEGENKEQARANARDCVITALEGYMKAKRPLPREAAAAGWRKGGITSIRGWGRPSGAGSGDLGRSPGLTRWPAHRR